MILDASRIAPSRAKLVLAFAAVYVIWGSTYLAIRFAIETLPPFFMGGLRFLFAGVALYVWTRWRGAVRPTRAQWRTTLFIGALLLVGGNGGVIWSETRVPSGIAALLVAMVPLWMVLVDWLRPGGRPPGGRVWAGIAVGFAGLAFLIGPGELAGARRVDLVGVGVLMLASLSWAIGSIYARGARLPSSPALTTAMEMLCAAGLFFVIGLLTGETGALRLDAISLRSALALLYLVVFGSLVGFSAYVWLLGVTTPARLATYAYVNPVIAVFLGWAFASEPVTLRTLLAAAVIIAAVALITTQRERPLRAASYAPQSTPSAWRIFKRRPAQKLV